MNYLDLSVIEEEYYWNLYKQLRSFAWSPEDYPLDNFQKLFDSGDNNVECFIKLFSYLVFLDSTQVRMIPEFSLINGSGSPELLCLLAEHHSQEAVHCHSYQYITSPLKEDMRRRVYSEMHNNKYLYQRSQQILEPYKCYLDDKTNLNKLARAYFADYLLEGFLFSNGFLSMLYNENIFPKISTIIKLIWRDEKLHVLIFKSLVKQMLVNGVITSDECEEIGSNILKNELIWLSEVMGDFVPYGKMKLHSEWLMNKCLSDVGVSKRDKDLSNPFKYLYDRNNTKAKTNPMEGKSSNYSVFTGLQFSEAFNLKIEQK